MAIIKNEDIIAWEIDGEVFCKQCPLPMAIEDIKQDQIIQASDEHEDDFIFCDRCGKQL